MKGGNADYTPQYDTYTTDEYPPDWKARRRKVLQRDNYICQGCGLRSTRVDNIRFDIDHIVPKSDGGKHGLSNLQTLCKRCHAKKHETNSNLNKRARKFERRNEPNVAVRLIWLLLGPIIASVGRDEDMVLDDYGRKLHSQSVSEAKELAEGSGVTVEITVTDLWDSDNENIHQLGRVEQYRAGNAVENTTSSDQISSARFIIWSGNEHPRIKQGNDYRLVGAETSSYNGDFQLVVDGKTAIQPL